MSGHDEMTDADQLRAKPGCRWSVATACSGELKEVEPPCSCPCHVAKAPAASGWYCGKCYSALMGFSIQFDLNSGTQQDAERVPYSHEQAIADGTADPRPYKVNVPAYYFLTCGNTLEDGAPRRHFKTLEAAERAAEKLNEEEAIASLNIPNTHRERFDRYRKLHAHLGWGWDGDHPLTRFAAKPGRYAVETYGDGDSYWSECETLDEVRSEIERSDVERVVDLDSGEDVPFARSVHVEIA